MMALGRTSLRAVAGKASGFLVMPGRAQYFHIELSSRYRWYVAPARMMLVALCGIVGGAILWSVIQTGMTLHDLQDAQAGLDHVRMQDQQLLAQAQREGLDLSGPSLQQLPEDLRSALTLREIEGLSYEEIASVMNCPIGTVRSRIFRAREAVAENLRPLLETSKGNRW